MKEREARAYMKSTGLPYTSIPAKQKPMTAIMRRVVERLEKGWFIEVTNYPAIGFSGEFEHARVADPSHRHSYDILMTTVKGLLTRGIIAQVSERSAGTTSTGDVTVENRTRVYGIVKEQINEAV